VPPPPPPSRTDWKRLVPPPVLTGRVASPFGQARARAVRAGGSGASSGSRFPGRPPRPDSTRVNLDIHQLLIILYYAGSYASLLELIRPPPRPAPPRCAPRPPGAARRRGAQRRRCAQSTCGSSYKARTKRVRSCSQSVAPAQDGAPEARVGGARGARGAAGAARCAGLRRDQRVEKRQVAIPGRARHLVCARRLPPAAAPLGALSAGRVARQDQAQRPGDCHGAAAAPPPTVPHTRPPTVPLLTPLYALPRTGAAAGSGGACPQACRPRRLRRSCGVWRVRRGARAAGARRGPLTLRACVRQWQRLAGRDADGAPVPAVALPVPVRRPARPPRSPAPGGADRPDARWYRLDCRARDGRGRR